MGDLILQTEPAEFQYSKQSTKMAFLHQEIRQLQEYIQDLEKVVRLNKDAMRIAISSSESQPPKRHGQNDADSTSASNTEGADKSIGMQQIIDHLHQENISLLNAAQRLRKEREMAESRALISEQICEEAQRHENEVLTEMEEKIYELRKLVQDKEYTIQELEKIKAIPDGGEVAIKYREVISPNEQSLKLLEEIDNLNKMLSKMSKEHNKLQAEKEELAHKNMTLTTELMKLEAALSLPLGGKRNWQNKLNSSFDGNEGGDSETFSRGSKQSNLLTSATQNFDPKKSDRPVDSPGIRQGAVGNPRMHEKLLMLEKDIDIYKKLLSREMINNNLLQDDIRKLFRQNSALISQNETLIKSNKRYEEKAQKMHYTLEFYREFYEKYMHMVTKRHNPTKSLSSQADFAKLLSVKKPSEMLSSVMNAPIPIMKSTKPLTSVVEESDHQVNISILEEDNDAPKQQHQQVPSLGFLKADPMSMNKLEPEDEEHKEVGKREITKEECKIFLLNLAKDLYMNSNITKSAFTKQILMNMDIRGIKAPATQVVKLKRSLSNPLDYISGNKKYIEELGKRKPIQKKTTVTPKKGHKESINMMDGVLDISAIGRPLESVQKHHVANKKSMVDPDISFAGVEDGKVLRNQEMSFISNDGLF